MKKEFYIKITLTKDEAEELAGIDIPLEEWDGFWECFKDFYKVEYLETLSWIGTEWEDELKYDYMDIDEDDE